MELIMTAAIRTPKDCISFIKGQRNQTEIQPAILVEQQHWTKRKKITMLKTIQRSIKEYTEHVQLQVRNSYKKSKKELKNW